MQAWRWGLVLLCVAAVGVARAQEAEVEDPTAGLSLAERYELLRDLSATTDQAGKPLLTDSYRSSFLRYLERSKRYYEAEDLRNAEQQLNSTGSYTRKSKVLADEVGKLQRALNEAADTLLTERTAAAEAYLETLAAFALTERKEDAYDEHLDRLADEYAFFGRYSSSEYPQTQRIREELGQARNFLNQWLPMLAAEAAGNYGLALQRLHSLSSSSSYRLLKHSQLQKRQAAIAAAQEESVTAALAALRARLETAEDIDAVQAVHNDFMDLYRDVQQGGSANPFYQPMQYAQQALQYWMNVVAAEEEGNPQQALQNLRNFEHNAYLRNTLLISSELLRERKKALTEALLEAPDTESHPILQQLTARIESAESVDELQKVAATLQGLTSSGISLPGTAQQEVYQLNNDLQQLVRERTLLQRRQFGQLFQQSLAQPGGAHRWGSVIARFREGLWFEAVQALCGVEHEAEARGADEALDDWLLRLADRAVAAEDWQRAVTCLDTYRTALFAQGTPPAWLTAELRGIQQFIVGRNFEQAGALDAAVKAYLGVMRQVGERVPVDAAAARLQTLRQDHPEAFEGVTLDPAPDGSADAGTPPVAPAQVVPVQTVPAHVLGLQGLQQVMQYDGGLTDR